MVVLSKYSCFYRQDEQRTILSMVVMKVMFFLSLFPSFPRSFAHSLPQSHSVVHCVSFSFSLFPTLDRALVMNILSCDSDVNDERFLSVNKYTNSNRCISFDSNRY